MLIILHVSNLDCLARYNVGDQAKNIFHPWPENIRSAMKTNPELFATYHPECCITFSVKFGAQVTNKGSQQPWESI